MTLGQAVSNILSAGLVAGYVGLRAYEWYHYSNRQQQVRRHRASAHGDAHRRLPTFGPSSMVCVASGFKSTRSEALSDARQGQEQLDEDELAFFRQQQEARRRMRSGGGPVVFTFSSTHGPQILHGDNSLIMYC